MFDSMILPVECIKTVQWVFTLDNTFLDNSRYNSRRWSKYATSHSKTWNNTRKENQGKRIIKFSVN